jgi:hypothetical protein
MRCMAKYLSPDLLDFAASMLLGAALELGEVETFISS